MSHGITKLPEMLSANRGPSTGRDCTPHISPPKVYGMVRGLDRV